MGSAVAVTRDTHTAEDLRRIASTLKDARQVQRVQAISLVMEGWSRAKAAAFAYVERQTLRDWVERYNECGVDGLASLSSPGRPRLRTPNQAEELRQVVISGPDLNTDGVVRWLRGSCETVGRSLLRARSPSQHHGQMAASSAPDQDDGEAVPPEEGRGGAGGIQGELQGHRRGRIAR